MARPRAGDWLEDEVSHWKSQGVELVVSLLEREEVADLDLGNERGLCAAKGIEFRSLPIADRGIPDDASAVKKLARDVALSQRVVVVHCRIGIGRSSLVAAAILCASGLEPDIAFAAIQKARGVPVPDTAGQREWIERQRDHLALRQA